jgi:phytoene dehydrogenase-like protein
MDYLEKAFDEAKYGWYSSRPYLDCASSRRSTRTWRRPASTSMSSFVQYAPYHLRESDWDTERQNLGDTVQRTLESFFPGFSDRVVHREVVTPLDIERVVGLSEGNIFMGEFFAPQMFFFRPAPGWSQYRTPIEGYYQCGSGTHPGGCVIGAPGKLAAGQIVKDVAKSKKEARREGALAGSAAG